MKSTCNMLSYIKYRHIIFAFIRYFFNWYQHSSFNNESDSIFRSIAFFFVFKEVMRYCCLIMISKQMKNIEVTQDT